MTLSSANKSFFNGLILLLAFVSGFIIMTIELLGGRILAPYFGQQHLCMGKHHHRVYDLTVHRLSVGRQMVAQQSKPGQTRVLFHPCCHRPGPDPSIWVK